MDSSTSVLIQKLAAAGCREPERAAKNLELLAPDASARLHLDTVLPDLLAALQRMPDPDLALNNLERFL